MRDELFHPSRRRRRHMAAGVSPAVCRIARAKALPRTYIIGSQGSAGFVDDLKNDLGGASQW